MDRLQYCALNAMARNDSPFLQTQTSVHLRNFTQIERCRTLACDVVRTLFETIANRSASDMPQPKCWTGRMIIRRRHTKNFTVIPNAIHDDDRLSLEARGLLGFLLSRPPNWEIRHDALRRSFHLSRQRLDVLLSELMAAGYLTREADQPRDENMRFTSYSYVVVDVPTADVTAPPSVRRQRKSDSENKKEEIKKSENKLSPKSPQSSQVAAQQASQDQYTPFGRAALSHGMRPVYEHSKPYRAWETFRGPLGMPPTDEAVINGRSRRLVWLPSVFPPPRENGAALAED